MDTASACQSCGDPITKEELAEGLAVRVDGRLVCSSCVDLLPGSAQVRINQMRAVRGLAATTYRVVQKRHPKLATFTYTTSLNLNLHRRELVSTGRFDAPLLPATGAPKIPPLPPANAPAGKSAPPLGMLIGGAVVVVGVSIALVYASSKQPAEPTAPAHTSPTPTIPTDMGSEAAPPAKQRIDYPREPVAAWNEASRDSGCPMPVLQLIAGELVDEHSRQLAIVDKALESDGAKAAAEALVAIRPLPDHLLFRSAKEREAALSDRIRTARVAAVQPKVDVQPLPERLPPTPPAPKPPADPVPPTPPPSITATVPEPVIQPEPPAPQQPVVAAPATTGEQTMLDGAQLEELPGRDDWRSVSNSQAIELQSDNGSVVNVTPVKGGTYQLWIKAKASSSGTVQAILGGQRSQQVQLPKSKKSAWIRVEPESFTLPAGPAKLQIVAIGSGSTIAAVYVAESSQPGPQAAGSQQTPGGAGETAPRPPWTPRFGEPHATLDPAVESHRVPSGLPGNAGSVLESTKGRNGGRHLFTIECAPEDVANGGMALLASPRRPDRTTLSVFAVDGDGKRTALDPVTLGKDPWQIITIDLSKTADVHAVVVEDQTVLTTGFLLAKLAVSSGAPATPEILQLRPMALMPLTANDLENALTLTARKRKWPAWRKSFDATKLKLLIGQKLTMGSWETDARKRLQDVLGINRLPNKTVEQLVMNDQWLDDLVKPPAESDPVLDPERHHLAIICTAGIEFPTGLNERQAFINFWQKLIEEVRARGVLPVAVLGPNKVDGEDKAEVAKLWNDLATWIENKHPGVPVIDLRPAQAVSANRFAPGGAELSIDLLGDGYADLLRRIELLRKSSR